MQERHGAAAVVTDRRQPEAGVGEEGHGAAPAITDHADLLHAARQRRGRRLHILYRAVKAQFGHQSAPALDPGGVVLQLDARRDVIEQAGRDCDEAV